MNRIARIRFGTVAFTLVVGLTALGQENGKPEALSVEFLNLPDKTSVVSGDADGIPLEFKVTGGISPYTIRISDDGPVDGGNLDETELAGDGPTFEFVYTAPSDDIGSNAFTVTVEDSDGAVFALPIFIIDVICPGIGLCTEKLTNAELMAIGVLGFDPETTQVNGDGETVVVDTGTVGTKLFPPNLAPANLLNRLDIDKDGEPDNVTDTDGDGLPDNWELGGAEENDRVVFYPAPSAIVPGTPPTPIFTRRAVATSAVSADTDGDGLSDFVEVFGLKFIDENGNGRLDPDEWADFNGDGMPSVGEFPLNNVARNAAGEFAFGLLHDFDGFMFTDPANPDTDGDGVNDGDDNDPLINPRSFGNTSPFFVRFNRSDDPDIDKDGIGNGMDMGNDLTSADGVGVVDFQGIDNPANMEELLDLFRKDLLGTGKVPESVVEDLLGADWNGNGLWRITDVLNRRPVVDPDPDPNSEPATLRPPDLFFILGETGPEEIRFYFPQTLDGSTDEELNAKKRGLVEVVSTPASAKYNGRGIGLSWQELLRPPTTTNFMPDRKIWAILYAWRVPGFDIDGDGFIGGPLADDVEALVEAAIDSLAIEKEDKKEIKERIEEDNIRILEAREQTEPQLDGVIEVPGLADFFRGCGGFGVASLTLLLVGLGLVRLRRRR